MRTRVAARWCPAPFPGGRAGLLHFHGPRRRDDASALIAAHSLAHRVFELVRDVAIELVFCIGGRNDQRHAQVHQNDGRVAVHFAIGDEGAVKRPRARQALARVEGIDPVFEMDHVGAVIDFDDFPVHTAGIGLGRPAVFGNVRGHLPVRNVP